MKRILTILLLLLPLAAAAQGELYKRYASRPDLTVAQVSGFRLDDTVRVDVVLMVADDEAAWQRLKKEFKINGEDGVESWLGNTAQPAQRMKWNGKPVLRAVASHSRRTIAFYRIDNETQYDALLDYQLNKMKQTK